MSTRWIWAVVVSLMVAPVARAENQVWGDGTADKVWSTSVTNWAGGAVWTNGNSAVFSGGGGTLFGETVDIAGDVAVSNITFLTNGYVIADANSDGTLSVTGGPSVISVVNAGDTGTVSETIGGSGGFTKTGDGQLRLTAANTYSGTTTVSGGVLRLSNNLPGILGMTGTGNGTVVAAGATLDFNGCYSAVATNEPFTISGAGNDGKGVLINSGSGHVNKNIGVVTMLDHSTIGGPNRIDAYTIYQNGYTLTKIGAGQLCVQNVSTGAIVINAGTYTLLSDNRGLGGTTPGDTIVNGGNLDSWNSMTVSERITFNGGTLTQGNPNMQLFTLSGYLTLNSNVTANTSSPTSGVEIAGYVDGAGGLTQANAGWLYITCNTNAYSGPTIINSSRTLWVGKTNLYSGVLGVGTVTNYGTLNGYSRRISDGFIVNMGGATLNVYTGMLGAVRTSNYGTLNANGGTLGSGVVFNAGNIYVNGGTLGPGAVTNTGTIYCLGPRLGDGAVTNLGTVYFDRAGSVLSSNSFVGTGNIYVRNGSEAVFSSASSSNYLIRLSNGAVTLTNGASLIVHGDMKVADRSVPSSFTLTNCDAQVNVFDASLKARYIVMGEGDYVANGHMAGTINQYGGQVSTYDCTAESNGIRVAHWPQADNVYNIRGGTLTVDNGWDFCIATDGTGWVHQTGGEIYTSRMMVHERMNNTQGRGRLTVEGGVLNIGLTNGIPNVVENGISVDGTATYLVEYGGMGGVIRAVTNFVSSLNATLYGAGTNAITFDTREWLISLSGRMSGAGGLNKAGSGTLTLSGNNTFSGDTRVGAGSLLLGAANALTNSAVAVASGAQVDLGGLTQKIVSLSGDGAVTNGSLKVSGAIAPGTNSIGTLTLAGVAAAAPGGTLTVDVTTSGACDTVAVVGDLDLTGMTLQVVDPGQLNTHQGYTIATFTGSLSGSFAANNLTKPWYVLYDRAGGTVQIRSENGTMIRVR